MLVISRKSSQSIHFPDLDISVHVQKVIGSNVKIGIDAPKSIDIIRGELKQKRLEADRLESTQPPAVRHQIRNRLNSITLALNLLQKQVESGFTDQAENTLSGAIRSFEDLDRITRDLRSNNQIANKSSRTSITNKTDNANKDVHQVLVVEDNDNERELLAGYLQLIGFRVQTSKNGKDAMRYLYKHEKPDVILLDMNMPLMNGEQTVSAIRENPLFADLKIFAVSGQPESDFDIPSGRQGIDGWFDKPLDAREISKQMHRKLELAC